MGGRTRTSLLASFCLSLVACANMRPPEPPSLDLPKPPSDLRATRKGDKVTLTWTVPTATTDRQTLRSLGPTRICRGLQPRLTECGTAVGQSAPVSAAPAPTAAATTSGKASARKSSSSETASGKSGSKTTASYIDRLPDSMLGVDPAGSVTYAIEVLNKDGHGAGLSNQVHVSLARTLPPPRDFSAQVTARGVVLNWTSNAPETTQAERYVYRVYRRQEGSPEQIVAGEVASDGENKLSITDASIEWEKTYEYHVEAVTVIVEHVTQQSRPEVHVEGDDTPEVKVFADDVFPPAVPSGLQAVYSGPGQKPFIDLIWAPDTDADLNGYNVYRHEEGQPPLKLNSEPVKTPAYRDEAVAPGKHYFYSVTGVDVRGNESARSEEAGESVP
jgi:hypothetical protein